MARPRVLITGFGPFPGVPDNPSSWLAQALAQRPPAECRDDLHVRVLPTEWQATTLMRDFYADLQPTLMIHFGLDQRGKSLRIERSAHNRARRRADACGALPLSPAIHANGPDRIDTAVPVPTLAAHLRRLGLPATASRSAGSYLCNFLYYHSLAWAHRNRCHALFVHIPHVGSRGSMSEAAVLRGAQEILSFMLDVAPAQADGWDSAGPFVASREAMPRAKDA
jgi:pyroglutamyl-peptidase